MFAVVGSGESNELLVQAFRARGVAAVACGVDDALASLGRGDTALVRLDVLPTLDGVQPGLDRVAALESVGVRLLNRPEALLRAHDKLLTALVLERAGIPHPRTAHVFDATSPPPIAPPVVVKPRFGSWGADVFRCETERAFRATLAGVAGRPWFRAHGALVQELVPAAPRDARILVARGVVVGAVERRAAPGEWRTNVSLGGSRIALDPTAAQRRVAAAAADALGLDLVGVDLLGARGGDVVVELNGAVDFDAAYSIGGADVYDELVRLLAPRRRVRAVAATSRARASRSLR